MDFPSLHIFLYIVLWEFLEKMTERKKSDVDEIPIQDSIVRIQKMTEHKKSNDF